MDCRSQISCHKLGIVADDFARIENVLRIENLLDLPQHIVERPGLPPQELRAAEPIGMFAADRAANAENLVVELVGHEPHSLYVVGIVQVEKRLDVQLPVAGMTQKRGGYLPPLEHVLSPHEKIGQNFGRHGDVFNHRHGPARPLEAIQKRHGPIRQIQKQIGLFLIESLAAAERQPRLLLNTVDQAAHLMADVLRFVALEFDQHGRFSLGRE